MLPSHGNEHSNQRDLDLCNRQETVALDSTHAATEREHKPAPAPFERIHQHHERDSRSAERSQHLAKFDVRARTRAAQRDRLGTSRGVSELIVVPSTSAPAAGASQEWLAAARRAKLLSWLSLVWMSLEGGIAITAGILAGSIALIGFGIDSAIEGIASVVIIWRFTGARVLSRAAEERAQKLVAIQFFLLAPYVGFEALQHARQRRAPRDHALGMALTASSVIGMPLLGIAKQRVATTLGSQATHGEGTQNLLCAYLAGRRVPRSRRQRALRRLVARPDRRPGDRRGRRPRGPRDLARRGLLRGARARPQANRLRGRLLR